MVDITKKNNTLRKAIATARVQVSEKRTIEAIEKKRVPKGDVFEFARAAGLLGVKKTSDVIPDCHPLPIEFTSITFDVQELSILILVEVHTIYKTGVEVEAMHGAAVAALTLYDMLKPIDKGISIGQIQLDHKSGGKSDRVLDVDDSLKSAVIVCSDSISKGQSQDRAGRAIIDRLRTYDLAVQHYHVIEDDATAIQKEAQVLVADHYDLILFCGGTGVSPRDQTPEAIKPLLDIEIPGIMETARHYGQQRMPYAILSRGVAGFISNSLVLTLPGSTNGAMETMDALFPQIFHLFKVRSGARHDDGK